MKRIFAYLRIELKKGIRVIPFFIQSFLVTTVVLGLALALICHFMLQSQTFVKMNIGVVVPDQETNTRMAMKLVSAMDSVDSICNFSYPDEETAREELADGKLAAVILLTEDFYDDVNDGVNTPVDILLAPDSPFDEAVFTELVRAGVSMLQTAQAAVYAVDEASGEYRLSMSKSDMEYELSYLYLSYAFARNSTFAEQEETPLGAVSLGEFYIVCGAEVLSLVFGVCFLSLYRSESLDFMRCLRRIGVNAPLQSVMRIFVMALDKNDRIRCNDLPKADRGIFLLCTGACGVFSLCFRVTGRFGKRRAHLSSDSSISDHLRGRTVSDGGFPGMDAKTFRCTSACVVAEISDRTSLDEGGNKNDACAHFWQHIFWRGGSFCVI